MHSPERIRTYLATLALVASVALGWTSGPLSTTGVEEWSTPRPATVRSVNSGDRGILSTRTGTWLERIPYVPPEPIIAPPPTPVPAPPPPVLRWPLATSGPLSSSFSSWHQAIDIQADCGTEVLAAAGGTITYAGWKNNGGGLVVDISSGDFILTYNHLSALAAYGGPVASGQVIGYVGATDIATGCHLHFGVYLNGSQVNPLSYL